MGRAVIVKTQNKRVRCERWRRMGQAASSLAAVALAAMLWGCGVDAGRQDEAAMSGDSVAAVGVADCGNARPEERRADESVDDLLAHLPSPDDVEWGYFLVLDELPAALEIVHKVRVDDKLSTAVLQKLRDCHTPIPQYYRLLWLASKLPGGSAVVTSKLKEPDVDIQFSALGMMALLDCSAEPDEWYAALRSSNETVAASAVRLAQNAIFTDTKFYVEAFKSNRAPVVDFALGSISEEVQKALLPLVVEKLRKLKSDEEVKENMSLSSFLIRYNKLGSCCFAPRTIAERDDLLDCHEEMEEAREYYADGVR